jgi:hypothetical protein
LRWISGWPYGNLWWEGILRGMKDTPPTLGIKKLIQPYELRGDVLYRRRIRGGVVSYQLCLPKSLIEQVLLACHSDVTAGHLGVTRTTYKIQQRYYWPGMRRQITRFVLSCVDCQTKKTGSGSACWSYASDTR